MLARSWALGFVCAFLGVLAGVTTGCSSKTTPGTADSLDAGGGESKSGASTTSNHDVHDDEEDAGRGDAGSIEEDAGSGCNANAVDDPDDDFTDTNCDGIDGNKKKAVFVAATGTDTADGTWGKPVATLKHAIDLATSQSKDVYACAGDYKESIIISSRSVRVYGGYDCTHGWARNSNSQARLIAPTSSALVITASKQSVVFDRVDIESADATGGDSSVAVFVSNSSQVTLRRANIHAGLGADAVSLESAAAQRNHATVCSPLFPENGCVGETGTNAYQYGSCFYNNQVGGDYYINKVTQYGSGSVVMASASDITERNNCNLESTYGGRGGGTNPDNWVLGTDGTPGYPPSTTGTLDGANGKSGDPGAGATQGVGLLNASGYVASNQGTVGSDGNSGQSGNGGNGGGFTIVFSGGSGDFPYYLYAPRAGGGKGGFGGCAGDGGPGGNAGGASIAVASYQSAVALERVILTTSRGGRGSAGAVGGDGAEGQPGGPCGVARYECGKCAAGEEAACAAVEMTNYTSAQSGGHGGKGGQGGQGGPGGGGPSIPLFVFGTGPSLSAVTFLPGAGGHGGTNGNGTRATDGESADQKVLP